MFVRAKKIKGQAYAYLVKNEWKKGKVKQVTKKYLGRIYEFSLEEEFDFEVDFSLEKKVVLSQFLIHLLARCGFEKHSRQRAMQKEGIIVQLSKGNIRKDDKQIVLKINDRYWYDGAIRSFIDFFAPEAEDKRPGTRLAQALSDLGIEIPPEMFIQLYKFLYKV